MKVSDFAASVTPYSAGEQFRGKKFVKLNTNENPYPPAPECEKVLKGFDIGELKLYPDIALTGLRSAIAKAEGVDIDNVFVGNGSDEVLALAFRAFYDPHLGPVVFPEITYSFYSVYCKLFGINSVTVANDPDFSVNVEKLGGGQGAVIANPNAPTSLSLPLENIECLLKMYDGKPVIVDEAYIDFAVKTSSAVKLVKKYENLAVIKTFSKSYSLAGIRCGYMIANRTLVKACECVRDCFNSYPVDSLCQSICTAAMTARDYHRKCVQKVIATRDRVVGELISRDKAVLPSDTNFLFVKGGKGDYLKLKERGVLVRWFDTDRTRDYTRVTVGSDAEMNEYLEKLFY